MFHLLLHFAIPFLLSLAVAKKRWLTPWVLMMLTMAVDIDHLLADPIYDPERCSIGFHPLHQWPWFLLYAALCGHRKTRWIGVGLVIHMVLDSIDCQFTNGVWYWLAQK
ncbi:MAG: DUF6122 family protein [Cellvibrionaceae bacterium]